MSKKPPVLNLQVSRAWLDSFVSQNEAEQLDNADNSGLCTVRFTALSPYLRSAIKREHVDELEPVPK